MLPSTSLGGTSAMYSMGVFSLVRLTVSAGILVGSPREATAVPLERGAWLRDARGRMGEAKWRTECKMRGEDSDGVVERRDEIEAERDARTGRRSDTRKADMTLLRLER